MFDEPLDLGPLLSAPSTENALSVMDQLLQWLLTSGVKIVIILVAATVLSVVTGWLLRRFFRTMVQSGTKLSSVTGAMIRRDPGRRRPPRSGGSSVQARSRTSPGTSRGS